MALQKLIGPSDSGQWRVTGWLLWMAATLSVILVYLATLSGSKHVKNEIDLPHTAALFAVFLSQCALFSVIIVFDGMQMIRIWLVAFSVFSLAAVVVIVMVVSHLSAWWRYPTRGPAFKHYRNGQMGDVISAGVTAVWPTAYLLLTTATSPVVAIVMACIAVATMVSACIIQHFGRMKLRRLLE
ncbi:hypothetical protein [Actinokineospora sp. HUAS TT18]|uniref:hypothetical protein n=1 Tax=Actinokineospora sp. HUAS TT18 TaxID=3447451 RepID=UPI003F527D7A